MLFFPQNDVGIAAYSIQAEVPILATSQAAHTNQVIATVLEGQTLTNVGLSNPQ